jgi:protein O-GlcNAc transferase
MDDTFDQLLALAAQFLGQGELTKAQEAISAALHVQPDDAIALHTQGLILFLNGNLDDAISFIKKAIDRDDTKSIFFSNLSVILVNKRLCLDALSAAKRAVELDDCNIINVNQLGEAYSMTNDFVHAEKTYEHAITIAPDSLNAMTQGLNSARRIGDFSSTKKWLTRIQAAFQRRDPTSESQWSLVELINLAYVDIIEPLPDSIFDRCMKAIDSRLQTTPRVPHADQHSRQGQKLRIAYLSGKLGDHPIGHVTQALFAAHDRTQFEVHAFSLTDRSAENTGHFAAIKAGCDVFHNASSLSATAVADCIQHAGIDILIFLDGLMTPVGLQALAQRPARFQVFWLGHAGMLNLSCIDATVVDPIVLPDYASFGSSAIALPVCYHCASPQRMTHFVDNTLKNEALTLNKPFVFCAFNSPEKINVRTFEAWMQILRQTPNSLLWLSNQFNSEALEKNLRSEAQQRGIEPSRLIFAARLADKGAHLGRHHQASLLLDSFDLNASTTALDALWAGLPLVTLTGNRLSSRIATTFLAHLGLQDLACSSADEFVSRAVSLAHNSDELASIRSRLASAVWDKGLFQPTVFVRAFEQELLKAFTATTSKSPSKI